MCKYSFSLVWQRPPGIMSILDDICSQLHGQSEGADVKLLEVGGAVCVHLSVGYFLYSRRWAKIYLLD